MWCKYDQGDQCRTTNEPPLTSRTIRIQCAVGTGGRNIPADVVAIQRALNQVAAARGGPPQVLAEDGKCGPLTMAAIGRFQRVQFNGAILDSRIDPDKKTLARLNELQLTGSGDLVRGGANAGVVGGPGTVGGSTTSSEQLDLARSLAVDAERRINLAIQRLIQAGQARLATKPSAREQQLVREVDFHFKADAADNPALHMGRVLAVYTFMLTAIRESTLGTRELFQGGEHPDPTAIAFAELGGFFSTVQQDRFIFITPIFRTRSSGVIVHELAHFCGGDAKSGNDIVHRASPRPPPLGTQREDGSSNYAAMIPFHARTNVFSYQVYCFPETPDFAVP